MTGPSLALRVGVIGTGPQVDTHVETWSAVGALPATFPTYRDTVTEATSRGGTDTAKLTTFLGTVDVVDICSTPYDRIDTVLAAAAARKPTMCESPVFCSRNDATRVIDAFDRAGVAFFVVQRLQLRPEYVTAEKTVTGGEIGKPAVLRLSDLAPRPAHASTGARFGGIFTKLMVDDFDFARRIAGDAKTVFARSASGNVDYAIALIKHCHGAITHLEASWIDPSQDARTSIEIACSRGLILSRSDTTASVKSRQNLGPGKLSSAQMWSRVPDRLLLAKTQQFTAALQSWVDAKATVLDALAALKLAEAAEESARTGRPVTITAPHGDR
jgi:myo-inositol 2-dehydrogenase/D-chiro-inositol 1-dehydrogenase